MLPKPDFSALDRTQSTSELKECTINKNPKTSNNESFRCIPCDQVFANANDLLVHEEDHLPCGFAGCDFEANFKVLLDHQTSVHMSLKKKSTHSLESSEDIEKWRAERRQKFPKLVNTQKELTESDQIGPVNSNECLDKSTSISGGLPTDKDHLQDAVGEKCNKEALNDSNEGREVESCPTRKRGSISTYGSTGGEGSNKFSNKKRRNQRKKRRDHHQTDAAKDAPNDVRWQSNATPEGKSGGNFGSTLTTKGISASGFKRRPTLFEKLMQSSVVESKSKDGDNE